MFPFKWSFSAALTVTYPGLFRVSSFPLWLDFRYIKGSRVYRGFRSYRGVSKPSTPKVTNLKFPMQHHSMKNLAFHSLLRYEMIILPILTTLLICCKLKGWENVLFQLGDRRLKRITVCARCIWWRARFRNWMRRHKQLSRRGDQNFNCSTWKVRRLTPAFKTWKRFERWWTLNSKKFVHRAHNQGTHCFRSAELPERDFGRKMHTIWLCSSSTGLCESAKFEPAMVAQQPRKRGCLARWAGSTVRSIIFSLENGFWKSHESLSFICCRRLQMKRRTGWSKRGLFRSCQFLDCIRLHG